MWQIKYKGEFFDNITGDSPELEKTSPLFISEKVMGEISTPLTINYSDTNCRLLGNYFFSRLYKSRLKIDVELYYQDGTYKCNATLVVESAGMHEVLPGRGQVSGYILTGGSHFFTSIKDKLLTQLNLGGIRTKNLTTTDPTDASDGYWQMFQQTWDFANDYVIAPCRNEYFTGSDNDIFASGYMNKLDSNNNLETTQDVVPFVKLKYVLSSIFSEHNWSVDFTDINDTDWEKLVLFSAKPISTKTNTYVWVGFTLTTVIIPAPSVSFKLNDVMPQNITCAAFINAICNRYGWVPLFESGRKCRFLALKEMPAKPVKDWTEFALPAKKSTIEKDKKIFAFKNNFGGNDKFPSQFSFDGFTLGAPVYCKIDLPSPYGAYDTVLIYVWLENQYYKVIWDPNALGGVGDRVWTVHGDNIYDADADDATDTFETDCTTLPLYRTQYRMEGSFERFAIFPYCEQSQFENWGIRTLFFHGTQKETDANNNYAEKWYPFLSPTNTDSNGNVLTAWANIYKYYYDNVDKGIITFWWQPWLDIIKNIEDQVEINFLLPLTEYINFKWDNKILLNNQQYLIKTLIETQVVNGLVGISTKCQKIRSLNNPFKTGVFIKLVYENTITGQHFEFTNFGFTSIYDDLTTGKVKIYVYSDAAGTIPLTVTNLAVLTKIRQTRDGLPFYTSPNYTTMINGNSAYWLNLDEAKYLEYDWIFNGLGPTHWVNSYELVKDTTYEIIP